MNVRLLENASATPRTESPVEALAPRIALLAAELVRHIDRDTLPAVLGTAVASVVPHKNFIVFRYRERFSAELIYTNLDAKKLRADMAAYCSGLYMLDPFFIASLSGRRRGLLRLEDIAPEEFHESEYYRMFYKDVNVLDEARFVIEVNGDEFVHVFVEREMPGPRYSPDELQQLRDLEPLIESVIEKHWDWRRMGDSVHVGGCTPLAFGIRNVIRNLRSQALTAREIDIVELSIKGHSAKSIAHMLDIAEGTVLNHKRHIYDKLGISSQPQLFHLFLQALYSGARAPAADPAVE